MRKKANSFSKFTVIALALLTFVTLAYSSTKIREGGEQVNNIYDKFAIYKNQDSIFIIKPDQDADSVKLSWTLDKSQSDIKEYQIYLTPEGRTRDKGYFEAFDSGSSSPGTTFKCEGGTNARKREFTTKTYLLSKIAKPLITGRYNVEIECFTEKNNPKGLAITVVNYAK